MTLNLLVFIWVARGYQYKTKESMQVSETWRGRVRVTQHEAAEQHVAPDAIVLDYCSSGHVLCMCRRKKASKRSDCRVVRWLWC